MVSSRISVCCAPTVTAASVVRGVVISVPHLGCSLRAHPIGNKLSARGHPFGRLELPSIDIHGHMSAPPELYAYQSLILASRGTHGGRGIRISEAQASASAEH